MDVPKILVVSGSAPQGSLNLALARYAAQQARYAGLLATEFDLRELGLPIYDADLEAASGVPEGAHRFAQAIADSNGLLVVAPEYNGFPTPLLLNAFDWLSRITAQPSHPAGLAVTANKPVALLSASPGPGGALRSMNYLRQYLQMAFQMIVVPQQFALGKAQDAFDDAGALRDPKAGQAVATTLAAWAALARALAAARTGS